MIDQVREARDAALARVAAVSTLDELRAVDADALGKKGALAALKTKLGGLAVEDRKSVGQAINEALSAVNAALDDRRDQLSSAEVEARIAAERMDLTEVTTRPRRGHPHLATQAWERLEDVFVGLGFQIAEGPEVETDFYNFEALNMPRSHPARSGFDTLFTDYRDDGTVLLRTHTSPVQILSLIHI